MEDTSLSPALFLIPTGLSNAAPSDVLPRLCLDVMKDLRFFIVENLRTARRWIRRCDPSFSFEGVTFFELNEHTTLMEVGAMLDPLRQGHSVGVMSEAGCPAVADPGADVVALAQREGLKVVPLVGPSSILMGLMGSGFNGQSFCFHGYLPIEEGERRNALRRLERESEKENRTQIFIETPYRNEKMFSMLLDSLLPDTKICVACDITAPGEYIVSKECREWKKAPVPPVRKRPAIFLIYRGSKAEERGKRR